MKRYGGWMARLAGVILLVWFCRGIALAWGQTSEAAAASASRLASPMPQQAPGGTGTLAAFGLSGEVICRATEPPTASPWLAVARSDAGKYQIDALAFAWKIWQESGFNPDVHTSSAGAIGIAQFMPGTAQGLGIDPHDPAQALDASARLDAAHIQTYAARARSLAEHYGGPSARYGEALALAAYNAGPGSVESAWRSAFAGGWPEGPWAWLWQMAGETQRYVPAILGCSL